MSAVTASAVYTYAVARGLDPARLEGLQGVDGAAVRLVGHEDVVAVVSTLQGMAGEVDAALRARLEDLAGLEDLARAHDAVVDALAGQGVVVPFRLATLHRDDRGVAEMLRRRHRQLRRALDRVAGRVELGVKVYAVPAALAMTARPASDDAAPSASPGRDYLRRRRDDRQQRERTFARAAAVARQVDRDLATLAHDVAHHRPQDPRLSGAAGENLLNASYLVDAGLVDGLVARANELDGAVSGVAVVVTGPWAPYSFAGFADETAGDRGPTERSA